MASVFASFSHISAKIALYLSIFSAIVGRISYILNTFNQVVSYVLFVELTFLVIVRLALAFSSILVLGLIALAFRHARPLGLLFLTLTAIFVYILPFTINTSLSKYSVRAPQTEVPLEWGAVFIRVIDEHGNPVPYAIVVLKFNVSVCMPCNVSCSNGSCCCCTCIANHSGTFIVQMNKHGKRIVFLPAGSYCVDEVILFWYNFTIRKKCFAVKSGLGSILASPPPERENVVSDGDLIYSGPCSRVTLVLRRVTVLFNKTGVYGFTFAKISRKDLCTCIEPELIIREQKLIAKYRFVMRVHEENKAKIWVFGDSAIRIFYNSSNCNLTISYNIIRVRSATNITQTSESFFQELYRNYVLWFNRTFPYAYLNTTSLNMSLPERYTEALEFLEKHKPSYFYYPPPGYLIEISLSRNGTVNATDYAVVSVIVEPKAKIPWNASTWYYYNYYWQYVSELTQYSSLIEFFSSLLKLVVNIFYVFIMYSLAAIILSAMLGSPTISKRIVTLAMFSTMTMTKGIGRSLGKMLSPSASIISSKFFRKIKLWFYGKVAETTQTTVRDILYADISRKYELLKDFYEKKLPSRRLAKLAAISTLTLDKILRYRRRAGLYYLIADISRSSKLEKLANFLQHYPYGVRRKSYGFIVSKIEERSALHMVKKALFKVISDPYSRVKCDLPYVRVVADRLARKYLKSLSGVNPSELYRVFLCTGDRNILKASQVLAAEMVLSGVSYARVFLERGGEALVAFVSSIHSSEPSREAIRAALKLGDVELAYQYALSYLNTISATLLLYGAEPPRHLYMISDKREFARAVLEWSEASRVELDEALLLVNAMARSARMLDDLGLSF
ncbi:MAG: hypothetical protein DRJ52_08945, partial [Thermoprotei archaeon]